MSDTIYMKRTVAIHAFPPFPKAFHLKVKGEEIFIDGDIVMDNADVFNLDEKQVMNIFDEIEESMGNDFFFVMYRVNLPNYVSVDSNLFKDDDLARDCAIGTCQICEKKVIFSPPKFKFKDAQPAIDYVAGFFNPASWVKIGKGFYDLCKDKYARYKLLCPICQGVYLYCHCGIVLRCAQQKEITCNCGQKHMVEY